MYNYSKIIGSRKYGRFRRQSDTKNAIPSNLLSHLQHTRNFRELFLYEFINSIDEEIPDGARGQEGYQRIPMTLGQKKRLRNQIFRDAVAIANKRNANITNAEEAYSADDPSILVEAFFNSEFGSRYASLKSEWLARGSKRRDVINRISGWSGFDNMQYYGAIAISPYDPLFEDSELFSEMGESYDGVVYCKAMYANGENHNIPDEHQIRNDRSCVDARLMGVVDIPVVGQDGKKKTKQAISVKGGYILPGKHILEASHENTAYIVNHGEMKSIDSALSASGYTAIARYIKSRKSKEDVKAYFEDAYETYGATDSKQIDFMKQLCNYLVEKGRPFSVEMARDGYPVARLETGVEIRLFNANPAESNYQGRIYDAGNVVYLGSSAGNQNYDWVQRVQPEDKMNMVKWYFGESPKMRHDASIARNMSNFMRIGRFSEKMNINPNGKYSSAKQQRNSAVYVDKSAKAGITIGSVSALNAKGYPTPLFLTAYSGTVTPNNDGPEKNMTEGEIKKGTAATYHETNPEKFEAYLPAEKRYPDYPSDIDVAKEGSDARIDYYMHLQAREMLNSWVEGAKDNFRTLVDVNDVIEKSLQYKSQENYEYPFSSDARVAEIQRLYFDAARGKYPEITGNITIHGSEGSEEREASAKQFKDILITHFENKIENDFGSIPEIIRDDLPVKQNNAKGMNVENVARYVNVENAAGVQANYRAIRHMIMRLGDDYTPNFIDRRTYMGAEIHNGNAVFDPKRKLEGATIKGALFVVGYNQIDRKQPLPGLDNKPVTKEMMFHTLESLMNSGCNPKSIEISVDEQGIIAYSAKIPMGATVDYRTQSEDSTKVKTISGQIGRIFEPDEYGAIHLGEIGSMTTFDEEDGSSIDDENYGNSKVIIPGYDAYLAPDDPEEPKTMISRLRLYDWKSKMKRQITECVRDSVFQESSLYNFVPHTSDLNSVYKHSYSTAFKEDEYQSWLPSNPSNPTPEEITRLNVIRTLSGRCRFPNAYGDGATTMAQSMLEHPNRDEAKMYDYYYSDLCDNNNLRVLGEFFDGVFDKDMTGTAKTQGIVRYLAEGVEVDSATGRVTPSSDKNASCALMKDDLFKFKDFDTWDRRLMSSTQVLTSLYTPRHVGVAMMNVDGWTFDDGFLVSKKFAESYPIDDAHNPGNKRPLKTQDKLSDLHGNKGVISKVIDPDFCSQAIRNHMSVIDNVDLNAPNVTEAQIIYQNKTYNVLFDKRDRGNVDYVAEAISQIQEANGFGGMDDVLTLFYENPNLDVVAAPYSGMSRFNGGSVRQLQQESATLRVNGKDIKGGMGYTDLIVVDMPVDVKTHFYKDSDIQEGKGRKASGQLAWALQSKGCDVIMKEFYGQNKSAMDNLREYAIAIGFDFDTEMRPQIGYHRQESRDERRTIVTPSYDKPIQYTKDSGGNNRKKNLYQSVRRDLHNQSLALLNSNGGVMELPFPLKFNTLTYVKGNTENLEDYMTIPKLPGGTYGLPILPAALRSGMEFQDGSPKAHDYTVHYSNIYINAVMYNDAKAHLTELNAKKTLSDKELEDKAFYEEKLTSTQEAAQASLDRITTDIIDRKFNTKHNVVRDDVMSSRLNHSATAVWSADPRLNLNEVSMSFEHAKLLGLYKLKSTAQPFLLDANGEPMKVDGKYVENPNLTQDDYEPVDKPPAVLVWRDPILHDSNVRYLNVKIDNTVEGVCINPLIDKPFDGDFDGDSVAIVALQSREAKAQAFTAFSMNSNLLNYGVKNEDGTYPLYIQDGLDVASNCYGNEELVAEYKELERQANLIEDIARKYEEDPEKYFPDGTVKWEYVDGRGTKKLPVKQAIRSVRADILDNLNVWSHKALTGIGTDHIIVEDSKSIIKSCQHIVDDGAKGSQSKMADFADNMGIHYELGEDGRVDIDTVEDITDNKGNPVPKPIKEGIARDVDKKIQETTAYKADNTAIGGTTSINGVTACRDKDIHAVLELTYPITQAILQSKHDPKDAKVKDEITRFWGKDIWDGYKLTGDWSVTDPTELQMQAHERIKVPVLRPDSELDKDAIIEAYKSGGLAALNEAQRNCIVKNSKTGEYQYTYEKCTPEEWKAQMKGMMTALKVDVNPDYIDRLAEIMTRTKDAPIKGMNGYSVYYSKSEIMGGKGTVAGFTDYAAEQGTLMDSMAYSNKLTAMVLETTKPQPRSLFSNASSNGVEIERQRQKIREATTKSAKAVEREKLNEMRVGQKNSSMFAPKVFALGIIADEDFKAGESMAKAKPIGRRDSFLTDEEYDDCVRYMGESRESYEERLASRSIREREAAKQQISAVELESVGQAESVEVNAESNISIDLPAEEKVENIATPSDVTNASVLKTKKSSKPSKSERPIPVDDEEQPTGNGDRSGGPGDFGE